MKCAILKYGFHSTGLTSEGDVFLNITFPENSSLIQNFTPTLSGAAGDEERAKKMYLDTLAPGTVSPLVLLCQHKDYTKVNTYILGLRKDMFLVLLLFSLCSYYAHFPDYKNYFKEEMVQPCQSFLFGKINVQNLGRSDDGKQRKKKA